MALTGRLKKWGRASGITAKKRKVLSGTGADSVVGRFVTLFFLPLCFTSTETVRLIRDGRMEVGEEVEGDYIYLSLHCHHQNDCCIKMGKR